MHCLSLAGLLCQVRAFKGIPSGSPMVYRGPATAVAYCQATVQCPLLKCVKSYFEAGPLIATLISFVIY